MLRVWALISKPERFEHAIQGHIGQLEAEEVDVETIISDYECQCVTGFAGKTLFTEDDLEK
jgi:hypothetical protein